MEIKPIKSEADYEVALTEIEQLWNAPEGSAECDKLDILTTLVEAYEAGRWSIDPPDPVEAIKFRMEQQGLEPKDLMPFLGQRNRVYEILNRRRALSMTMAYRLHTELDIPAEALLKPVKLLKPRRRGKGRRKAA
jgi:HTH-type transcriptional regulator/antitoxin HigA